MEEAAGRTEKARMHLAHVARPEIRTRDFHLNVIPLEVPASPEEKKAKKTEAAKKVEEERMEEAAGRTEKARMHLAHVARPEIRTRDFHLNVIPLEVPASPEEKKAKKTEAAKKVEEERMEEAAGRTEKARMHLAHVARPEIRTRDFHLNVIPLEVPASPEEKKAKKTEAAKKVEEERMEEAAGRTEKARMHLAHVARPEIRTRDFHLNVIPLEVPASPEEKKAKKTEAAKKVEEERMEEAAGRTEKARMHLAHVARPEIRTRDFHLNVIPLEVPASPEEKKAKKTEAAKKVEEERMEEAAGRTEKARMHLAHVARPEIRTRDFHLNVIPLEVPASPEEKKAKKTEAAKKVEEERMEEAAGRTEKARMHLAHVARPEIRTRDFHLNVIPLEVPASPEEKKAKKTEAAKKVEEERMEEAAGRTEKARMHLAHVARPEIRTRDFHLNVIPLEVPASPEEKKAKKTEAAKKVEEERMEEAAGRTEKARMHLAHVARPEIRTRDFHLNVIPLEVPASPEEKKAKKTEAAKKVEEERMEEAAGRTEKARMHLAHVARPEIRTRDFHLNVIPLEVPASPEEKKAKKTEAAKKVEEERMEEAAGRTEKARMHLAHVARPEIRTRDFHLNVIPLEVPASPEEKKAKKTEAAKKVEEERMEEAAGRTEKARMHLAHVARPEIRTRDFHLNVIPLEVPASPEEKKAKKTEAAKKVEEERMEEAAGRTEKARMHLAHVARPEIRTRDFHLNVIPLEVPENKISGEKNITSATVSPSVMHASSTGASSTMTTVSPTTTSERISETRSEILSTDGRPRETEDTLMTSSGPTQTYPDVSDQSTSVNTSPHPQQNTLLATSHGTTHVVTSERVLTITTTTPEPTSHSATTEHNASSSVKNFSFTCQNAKHVKESKVICLVLSELDTCKHFVETKRANLSTWICDTALCYKQSCPSSCHLEFATSEVNRHCLLLIAVCGKDVDATEELRQCHEYGLNKLGIKSYSVKDMKSHQTSSRNTLIALVASGLLLALLGVAGYFLMKRRSWSPVGERLGEDPYCAENSSQGNTVITVASQEPAEPREKPNLNGGTQKNGTGQASSKNGHSARQHAVADTEL